MKTLKLYNSVQVKDNCARCLSTPYFRGGQSNGVI